MLNIKLKGKYTNENQLINNKDLPKNAIQFKEGTSITHQFIQGMFIIFPIMIIMILTSILKIKSFSNNLTINSDFLITFLIMLILSHFLTYIHEIIHALLYPKYAIKEIWKDSEQFAYFVYCDALVSKKRFIMICITPVVILGIIPFFIWIIIAELLPINLSICFSILTWIMTFMGIGDFTNIYNTIVQVPKTAMIFNYGLHSYWINI